MHERGLMEGRVSTAGFEDGGNHVTRRGREQPQLTASKEMETSVLQPQRTEFGHNHTSFNLLHLEI